MADYVLDRLADQGSITQEEEEYLRQFDVLGDDFRGLVIRRETAELFDKTIDQVFGTITTTSTPPIFGQPNGDDSLEFLRRSTSGSATRYGPSGSPCGFSRSSSTARPPPTPRALWQAFRPCSTTLATTPGYTQSSSSLSRTARSTKPNMKQNSQRTISIF